MNDGQEGAPIMSQSRHSGRIRRFRPEIDSLENRKLLATAVATVIASPALLSPPNDRFVKVTVHGTVYETISKITPTAIFQVSDEYRQFEPGGKVVLNRTSPTSYAFRFSVTLQAHRSSQDYAGRQYFVLVGAQDFQNAHGLTIPVLVPFKAATTSQLLKATSSAQVRVAKPK